MVGLLPRFIEFSLTVGEKGSGLFEALDGASHLNTPYFLSYVFQAPDSLWVLVQSSLTEPSLSIFVT